jgi:hypothetical protein
LTSPGDGQHVTLSFKPIWIYTHVITCVDMRTHAYSCVHMSTM